jgi:hypothetical protein
MIDPPFRSPRDKVGGLYHFGRMLDKIRLHLRGGLPGEYKENFGAPDGLDGLLAQFLNLGHSAIMARVNEGGTDERDPRVVLCKRPAAQPHSDPRVEFVRRKNRMARFGSGHS